MKQITILPILTALLLATGATAQVNSGGVTAPTSGYDTIKKSAPCQRNRVQATEKSYTGSIFTKVPVFTEDFSTNNYSVGRTPGVRYQSRSYAQWQHVADTSQLTLSSAQYQQIFPVLFGFASGGQTGFRNLTAFMSQTPNNGFMVMSMEDQIQQWGGTGDTGKFDSWIAFSGIQPVSGTLYDVSFYQGFRKFNFDSCFVEYSSDSTNWHSIHINRKALDINVNAKTWGQKTVSLPPSVSQYNTLYVRIRWYSDTNIGGAYGYYWMIDDFEISTAPLNRLSVQSSRYDDGFYRLVPQGMGGNNFVWQTRFRNNGAINQTNVVAKIKSRNTVLAQSQTMALLAPDPINDTFATIDPTGRIEDYFNGSTSHAQGTAGRLPSANVGLDTLITTLSSDSLEIGLDTLVFRVTNDSNGNRIWGRDNGVLVNGYRWCPYLIPGNRYLWLDTCTYLAGQGYTVAVMYGTPDTVPSNWAIRGVEIVPSSFIDNLPGSDINAVLLSASATTQNNINFTHITTGAITYTVAQSDISQNYFGYHDYGTYNTIRIFFPDQPMLQANQYYYIGYQTVSGQFFPAADRSSYFRPSDTANVPLPNLIGGRFGVGSTYNALLTDQQQFGYPITIAGDLFAGSTPMIRMIVGPRVAQVYDTIRFSTNTATDGAIIYDGELIMQSGTRYLLHGNTLQFDIYPDQNFDLDSIYIDGVAIDPATDTNLDFYQNYLSYTYTINNNQSNRDIRVIFTSYGGGVGGNVGGHQYGTGGGEGGGDELISSASNAVVKIQPNPATNQVRLTVDGVKEKLQYSIIDLNGRTLLQGQTDTDAQTVIKLGDIARGTYFVKITGNGFSKVEKIVVLK